ncbi:recombinase family protein [Paenibacillus sp. GP183]|uniref:recombinase family protein n=1 Tax=Paenibacillus sp. GP183 TaxID=1882751 RepID=UPI000899F1CA|nr:recombinase family protein [Paenibacillus sp. GP183]SEB93488.1 Site-specific DNA recombinase [Paenibacillus sp. GP183]
MHTVGYYRNSITTEKQKLSIKMQLDHADVAAKNHRLVIDHEFIDSETSAMKKKAEEREELTLLMDWIDRGKVANLLVYRRDRLARNLNEHLTIYRKLKAQNVNVIFTSGNEVPMLYTDEGELIETILAGYNQEEGKRIVKKLVESRESMARDGLKAAGPQSFGYKVNPSKAGDQIKLEEEEKVIVQIFEDFVYKDFNKFSDFVRHVNNYSQKTKKQLWHDSDLKSILKNALYKGIRVYVSGGQTIVSDKAQHLRMVSDKLWEEAQLKLESRPKKTKKTKESQDDLVFLFDVKCGECGEHMTNIRNKYNDDIKGYYKCKAHPHLKFEKTRLEMMIFLETTNYLKNLSHQYTLEIFKKDIVEETRKLAHVLILLKTQIENLSQTLNEKTLMWIEQQDNQELSDLLLQLDKKLETSRKGHEYLEKKIFRLKQLPKKAEQFIQNSELPDLLNINRDQNKLKNEIIPGIIAEIAISDSNLDITFKHPFKYSIAEAMSFENT